MKKHIKLIFVSIFLFVNCLVAQSTKIKSEAVLFDQSGNTYKKVKIGNQFKEVESYTEEIGSRSSVID
jgi:hypothetical protein